MSAINIGNNAKGVRINGVDINRVGLMVLAVTEGEDLDKSRRFKNADRAEKRIATIVGQRVLKMRSKGYLTKACAQYAHREIVNAAQIRPTKTNGGRPEIFDEEKTPTARPESKPLPMPVHGGDA